MIRENEGKIDLHDVLNPSFTELVSHPIERALHRGMTLQILSNKAVGWLSPLSSAPMTEVIKRVWSLLSLKRGHLKRQFLLPPLAVCLGYLWVGTRADGLCGRHRNSDWDDWSDGGSLRGTSPFTS
nr:hypothetical protein Itr_chr07CG00240 [Ipomoea trifida]